MARFLNILMVEDSQDDVDLLMTELRRAGFNPKWERVETETDFLAGLKKKPDLVISDYSMPQFSGLRAADLLKQSGLNIPFILISGTVGEDVAVAAMKHGAADYLLKDRLTRLGSAVEQALEQKRLREERQRTVEELRWKTTLLEAQLESSIDGIMVVDDRGRKVLQNRRMNELWKIPRDVFEDKDDAAQVVFATNQTKNPKQFVARVKYLYAHPDEIGRDEIELIAPSWTATPRPSVTRPENFLAGYGIFGTSPSAGNWSSNFCRRKKWSPSASSPAASRTTSTTFFPRSSATSIW
jgi:hypothetical protein